jgi:hypothetical protein
MASLFEEKGIIVGIGRATAGLVERLLLKKLLKLMNLAKT